jgi:uncharacterized repeat protein (TIGR02543 family)
MAYTYTLKYNANGGSGAPSTQSATTDKQSHTFTIASSEPSRTGYRFLGWSTSSSASSASYSPGGSITLYYAETNTVTLYAVWKKRTYTVSYSANGGSGAPGSQTKTYGVTLTLSSTTPTRSGYTFQGWATSASGGVAYSPGGTYTDNASITLYAVWSEDGPTTYSVWYNANGGTGAPASQTKTHGVPLTLRTGVPTREDYDFLGWGTSPTATSPTYQPGGTYTANSSVTLYAVWSGIVPATGVMYHSDGTAVMPGDPYIANNGLLPGTAFIVVGGVLKEGK